MNRSQCLLNNSRWHSTAVTRTLLQSVNHILSRSAEEWYSYSYPPRELEPTGLSCQSGKRQEHGRLGRRPRQSISLGNPNVGPSALAPRPPTRPPRSLTPRGGTGYPRTRMHGTVLKWKRLSQLERDPVEQTISRRVVGCC